MFNNSPGLQGPQPQHHHQQSSLHCHNNNISRKLVARKTAGTRSYVELITDAILSSPEKRLTANEIYERLICNVNLDHSPASLKNTIRHTLSWYKKFKRVQRGTLQKPSWWTVVGDKDMASHYKPTQGYPGQFQQQPSSAPILLNYHPDWLSHTQPFAVSTSESTERGVPLAPVYQLPQQASYQSQLFNNSMSNVSAASYAYYPKLRCLPHRQPSDTIGCYGESADAFTRMEYNRRAAAAAVAARTFQQGCNGAVTTTQTTAVADCYKQTVASFVVNKAAAAAAAAAYGLAAKNPLVATSNGTTAATFFRDAREIVKPASSASTAYYLTTAACDNKIAGLTCTNYHSSGTGSFPGALINSRGEHGGIDSTNDSSSWLLCQLT